MSTPSANSLKGRIYLAIMARLSEVLKYDEDEVERDIPSLRWIDKNMGQFNRPEMHDSIPLPGILISFPGTGWKSLSQNHQQGVMRVRIEIGYENYASSFDGSPDIESAIRFFEFNEAVHQALQGWSCPGMTSMERVADEEDDDHGAMIVTALEYETTIEDRSASKMRSTTRVETNIIPTFHSPQETN